jgi:hypothetical protein
MPRHRKLSKSEVTSVLTGVHRVLKKRDVEQPVLIQFATAESALCWKRECVTLPNGNVSCRWVQVPC